MSDVDLNTNKLNSSTPSYQIGIFITSGDEIVNDEKTPESFKLLRVRTAGDIVYVSAANNIVLITDAQPGEYHPAFGHKVLSAGTLASGKAVTTTATGITWLGGQ